MSNRAWTYILIGCICVTVILLSIANEWLAH